MVYTQRSMAIVVVALGCFAAGIAHIAGAQSNAVSYRPAHETNASLTGAPLVLNSYLVPHTSACAMHATSGDAPAPNGVSVARLISHTDGLAGSVESVFPPCGAPSVAVQIPTQSDSYQVLGQIQYTGTEGSLIVLTVKPSASVLASDLTLGTSSGQLQDGTQLWSMQIADDDGYPTNHLRWIRGGLMIDLVSDLSFSTLTDLAQSIVVD